MSVSLPPRTKRKPRCMGPTAAAAPSEVHARGHRVGQDFVRETAAPGLVRAVELLLDTAVNAT